MKKAQQVANDLINSGTVTVSGTVNIASTSCTG